VIAYGKRERFREAIRLRLEGWRAFEVEPKVGWHRGAGKAYFESKRIALIDNLNLLYII
jgi:hypothetical protein